MNIKDGVFSLKNGSTFLVVSILLLVSCQRETEILSATDTQNVDAEVASTSYISEGSGISMIAIENISAAQFDGGRVEADPVAGLGDKDDRLKCAKVMITRTGTKDKPAGTITITFDPSCADRNGVKRSGSIVITYNGKRSVPGSYWTLKYKEFSRNDTHIEGTDSVVTQLSSNSQNLQFQSFLIGGKITFQDKKSITQVHNLTREWLRTSTPTNDEWHTLKGGTASGTTKKGNSYEMQITNDIVEKLSCRASKVFIPVSGTKKIIVTTPQVTNHYKIDYGDGSCDNDVKVIINGKMKIVTVSSDGN
ncbi:hypothetical protein WSM22_36400 [Cytophagales bacterium WSM2-2]|nr:hypothetical protein WSM22_36400 [Cytophagales bacterium WSM2-2]